jgi:hypothetical protein
MLKTMELNASRAWGAWLDDVCPGTREKLPLISVVEKPSPPVEKPSPLVEKPSPLAEKPSPLVEKPSTTPIPVQKPAASPVRKQAPVVQKPPITTTPPVQKPATPAVQKPPAITIPPVQKPSLRLSRSQTLPLARVNATVDEAVEAFEEESKMSDEDEQDQDHTLTSEEEAEGGDGDDKSGDEAPLQDESDESEEEFPPEIPDPLPTGLKPIQLLSLFNHKARMRLWVAAQKEQGMPRVSHLP